MPMPRLPSRDGSIPAAVARADYRGDAFPLLKRQLPEWMRDRWDRAAAELDGHQRLGI